MLVARRLLALADGLQAFLLPARHPTPGITISDEWHALGPFTIGTREAAWSSDPLEHYGGFHALRVDDAKRFASALMPNGTTAWSAVAANVTYPQHGQGDVTATVSVSYPAVDWEFLRQVYGWAAVQWQGWVRGHIHVNTQGYQLINIYLNQVFELWIDDDHYYGGDFYGFGKVPLTVRLESGTHQVDIRLIRDTRAMGGLTKEPAIEVSLSLQVVDARLARWTYIDVLYSDWNGTHLSTLASGVYHNTGDEDAYIVDIFAAYPRHCTAVLISQDPIRLLPHQSRPVASRILCEGPDDADTVILHFTYQTAGEERVLMDGAELRPPVSMHEPRVITYLHPAGFVSSAILRPPPASHVGNDSLPVLLVLHGAGVDINSEQAKHSMDGVADLAAWILMPSGSTAWSGDDWHSWGWADVKAALVSIPVWLEQNGWPGPGVDLSRCLVTGHSNGGQGVWYALTHHPDRFIAAAPVSGYSSIQNYVPYTFWYPAEPAQEMVLQAQLSEYRHELLLSNTKDIPILQQHGSADDNVPAYHSRLMHDLLVREGSRSNYSEFSGMPHWWDNVMTTEPLTTFYKHHLTHGRPLVDDFTLVVADPGSTGSKGGITVLEKTPDLLSYVQVWIRDGSAHLSTSNVGALHLDTGFMHRCVKLTVDDQDIIFPPPLAGHAITLVKSQHQTWKISTDRSNGRRQAGQYGGLEAILRTNGSFQIVQHSAGTSRHAVQAANSLLQYFDADVAVAESYDQALEQPGNIISFAVGADLLRSSSSSTGRCHIRLTMNATLAFVREGEVLRQLKIGNDHVVAAAFLQPLPQGRLELILWAIDDAALDVAARFVPLLTGSGFPDFIFATRAMLSRGLAGVTGIGFLDAFWCPTSNSYFSMRDTQTGKTSV